MRYNIGDVHVIKGKTIKDKFSCLTCLNERVFMFLQFYYNKPTGGYTLWKISRTGAPMQISTEDVNWETSGIPSIKGTWKRIGDSDVLKCATCGAERDVHEGILMDEGLRCSCDKDR